MPRPARHPRDLAILRHLADGPSWYVVISLLFFFGKACGHIVKRLADEGLVAVRKRALPGGVTLVEITKAGCHVLGDVPIERAKPAGGGRLDLEIAARWHGVMEATRRYRLHARDLERLFGERHTPPKNALYLASASERDAGRDHPCVARTYLAGSSTKTSVTQLRSYLDDAVKNAKVRPWAEAGDYFLLAFSDRKSKVHALQDALRRADLADHIQVALAPTAESLSKFLKRRKKNT